MVWRVVFLETKTMDSFHFLVRLSERKFFCGERIPVWIEQVHHSKCCESQRLYGRSVIRLPIHWKLRIEACVLRQITEREKHKLDEERSKRVYE